MKRFSNVTRSFPESKSLFEKGADPLEASRLDWFYGLTGEGQPPFRIGSKMIVPPPRLGNRYRENAPAAMRTAIVAWKKQKPKASGEFPQSVPRQLYCVC